MDDIIVIPRQMAQNRYVGGLEQPADFLTNRQAYAGILDDNLVCVVTGEKLHDEDSHAFTIFESRFSEGKSTLEFDGKSLCLTINMPTSSLTTMNNEQIYRKLVDCYATTDARHNYLGDRPFIRILEKGVTVHPIDLSFIKKHLQRAPDVFQ